MISRAADLSPLRDTLFRNSAYLMLTSLISAILGFAFWIVAAKVYSKESVGIATGLISLMSLIVLMSRLGMDQALIRFLPEGDKSRIFSTSLILPTVAAILLGIIAAFAVVAWIPELDEARTNALLFLGFIAGFSLTGLAGQALIALRRADQYLIQNIFIQSRVLFLIPLSFLGSFGIFSSFGLSLVVAFAFSLVALRRMGVRLTGVDFVFLRKSFGFSSSNYLVTILMAAPTLILPIMVVSTLGSEAAADYYIAFALVQIALIVPGAFSTSLFVEGSSGAPLRETAIRALKSTLIVLVPVCVLIFVLGGYVLQVIGESYVEGLWVLRLIALSSIFVTAHSIFFSVKRVQKRMGVLVLISGLSCGSILSLSYYFMIQFGLIGVGYAWLANYGAICGLVVVLAKSERWF